MFRSIGWSVGMLCSPGRSLGRPLAAARRSSSAAACAAVLLLGGTMLAAGCAPPPPVCSTEIRAAQQEKFIEQWGTWGPAQQWLAGWYWSDPANCVEPEPDPETPPPVVPEAPLVVLLPLGAAVLGAGALVVTRRRATRD